MSFPNTDFLALYIVAILSNLRQNLEDIYTTTFWLLLLTFGYHVISHLFTPASTKNTTPPTTPDTSDAYRYHEACRTTRLLLWMIAPVFVFSYCLQELVKNPRTQRLFTKSTAVATKWLDTQLGVSPTPPTPSTPPNPPPPAQKPLESPASSLAASK